MPWFDRGNLKFDDSWETDLGLAILALSHSLNSSDELYRLITAVEDGGLAFYLGEEDALDIALKIRDQLEVEMDFDPVPMNAERILKVAQIEKVINKFSWSSTDIKRRLENLQTMVTEVIREAQSLELNLPEVINRLAGYGAVQIMSGHQSKGKEFDYVFIVGLEDDVLPNYRTHNKDISEERRIFYVSLTRTRKAAYLTSAKERQTYYSGSIRKTKPSRFISHIPEEFFSSAP